MSGETTEPGGGRVSAAFGWVWRQLVRIRTRLLVINLIAVLVPVVGIEWARSYERESLRALEDDMIHQVQVIRTILEHNLDEKKRPRFELVSNALETFAKRTRMRIRLLSRRGEVVADSHSEGAPEGPEPEVSTWFGKQPPPERRHPTSRPSTDPGPLHGRAEIKAAGRGELGTATRIHERIQRVFLFAAMPVMVERRVTGIVYITRSTTPVLLSLHRLRRQLVRVLAVALGITVLMSLFLAATISRPLSRLTRAAQRLAQGDRSVSLRQNRNDEIGQLAQAFDSLIRQLDARAQYISEFAANISHEFKTPLTSIRGAAELLADGAAEDPEARTRFLNNIGKDVQRLDRLVSRILELSRIEATAALVERREDLDFAEVVRSVTEQFDESLLEIRLSAEEIPVLGNRQHLESALRALVENAIRFSSDGGTVKIDAEVVEPHPRTLVVRVADEGPGISRANQAKVFDRFFTTEAEQGGTGLGLAVVAVVVRAHGGTVELHSERGAGCTFELRMPIAV
jgi:two-component system sensor histidine kinase ChvG